jgi:hypothetical protein
MTQFVGDTFVEAGVSPIPAEVISVERCLPAAGARNVGAPDAKLAVRRVHIRASSSAAQTLYLSGVLARQRIQLTSKESNFILQFQLRFSVHSV